LIVFLAVTLTLATLTSAVYLCIWQELLHKVSSPDVAAAMYLYTTPPKTVLKDMSATLYQLQLIPAAHIYIGCDDKKLVGKKVSSSSSSTDGNCASQQGVSGSGSISGAASWLRPEVLALMQDSVPQLAPIAAAGAGGSSSGEPQTVAAAMEAQRALRLAAAAGRQAAGGSSAAGGSGAAGKVPKWMKIGKN
jgi:tether containing UBX domain for GLUT4